MEENIISFEKLESPKYYKDKVVNSEKTSNNVGRNILEIRKIISGEDKRRIFIVGPCSIHDYSSAIIYANKLKEVSLKVEDKILILMRVYLEKPRTSIGWKGYINDPDLNSSFDIKKGLELGRKLLVEINQIGLGVASEFLDVLLSQYISDLISWGAIGARTVESQIHRQFVSGLNIPVGYKNATSGNIIPAINAIKASRISHNIIGIDEFGDLCIKVTKGNNDCHIILRGGDNGPNYEKVYVNEVVKRLSEENLNEKIMIDCSHGNSLKDYKRQVDVFREVIFEMKKNDNIFGLMLESNLNEGRQDISNDLSIIKKGVSLTDGCIGFDETQKLILEAYEVL